MKKLIIIGALVLCCSSLIQSQMVWMEPAAGNFYNTSTLYVDVSQSTGANNGGLKDILLAHTEEVNNVYIWAWAPSNPVVGNGNWEDSEEQLKMTWVSDLIFSIELSPFTFFNTIESNYYASGISFLLKLDSGMAYGFEGFGEAKTEDLHLDVTTTDIQTTEASKLLIYPNPCNGEINVRAAFLTEMIECELYDNSGALVHLTSENNSGFCRINTLNLPTGFYQLVVRMDKQIYRQKLTVVHH